MAGILINSNFDVNQTIPIDSRLVATSSVVRENITWKYAGLKVYQTDNKKTYLWDGATWSQEANGIYGGSGSLVGDTYVYTGVVGATSGNKSSILFLSSNSGTNTVSFSSQFNRHTTTGSPDWTTVEVKNQYRWKSSSGSWTDGPYISYNPSGETNNVLGNVNDLINDEGGLAFGTGDGVSNTLTEKLRITPSGKIGINTILPKESLQIGPYPVTTGQSLPLTFHKGGTTVIGYNWYFEDNNHKAFNSEIGSSRIGQSNGEISFMNRPANEDGGSGEVTTNWVNSVYIAPTGNVGINNTAPSEKLDVIGNIKTSGNIKSTGGSITNYEQPTSLTTTTLYYSTGNNNTPTIRTDNIANYSYRMDAYRIGALVTLTVDFYTTNIQYGGGTGSFYGWTILVTGQRFRPINKYFGVGSAGYNAGLTMSGYAFDNFGFASQPVSISVFTQSNYYPPVSPGSFYVQLSPYGDGSAFRAAIRFNVVFNGTITYVAGND